MTDVRALAVSAAAVLWMGIPAAVTAQEREGAWIAGGGGVASFDASPPAGEGGRQTIGLGHAGVGGWLHQRWQIGLDVGWSGDVAVPNMPRTVTPFWISALIAYYPRLASGFHVKGSVGGTGAVMTIVDEFGTENSPTVGGGGIVMAGVGWDVQLARRFWLVPEVNFRFGQIGNMWIAGRPRVTDWEYNAVDFIVGIRLD